MGPFGSPSGSKTVSEYRQIQSKQPHKPHRAFLITSAAPPALLVHGFHPFGAFLPQRRGGKKKKKAQRSLNATEELSPESLFKLSLIGLLDKLERLWLGITPDGQPDGAVL